ncbi:hypothetical protein Bbelb_159980 [Branchiostoma belcheri]|nr:hypothetical protein Bbelb_159980 [Branchiostoma belcheri]
MKHPTGQQPPAAFYGLPKIHKTSIPLRPIISSIGSVTYELSRFLANIIGPLGGAPRERRAPDTTQPDLVMYVRWGREDCGENAKTIYSVKPAKETTSSSRPPVHGDRFFSVPKIFPIDTSIKKQPGQRDHGHPEVKATCYKALVRPHLEYSATVWDPHTIKGIQAVEAVQRRAARVTLNDYRRTSSWNSLPGPVVMAPNVESFRAGLAACPP